VAVTVAVGALLMGCLFALLVSLYFEQEDL
jgi:hypothetical protein